MTTLKVTINEKTSSGRNLIAKLRSSPEVSVATLKPSPNRRKRKTSGTNEDRALGDLMRKEETGELVSKDSILKALKSVK